jgi:hypothetical protein
MFSTLNFFKMTCLQKNLMQALLKYYKENYHDF